MTKQEFMTFSLPHGLKIKQRPFAEVEYYNATTYFYDKFSKEILPILRPLSDLTKEIEHGGEKFVPIERLQEELSFEWCGIFDESVDFITEFWNPKDLKDKVLFLPHLFIDYFVKWHFDIAGLIEKEEAIDVNTLSENPYK